MAKRALFATYCDDIRHEVNGKLSLIGCYAGEMYVPSFPVTLPRLCVHFTLTTPNVEPFEGPLTVSVLQNDALLAKMELDASWGRRVAEEPKPGRETLAFVGGTEISPITFEGPATMRIIAEAGGETLHGPKLWVSERPQQE